MIRSMTAFTRQQQSTADGELTLEMRSVNHRYLEVAIRLPATLMSLEGKLRDRVRHRLGRGKVDITINLAQHGTAQPLALNIHRLAELNEALTLIQDEIATVRAPDALAVLAYPGVVQEQRVNTERMLAAVDTLLDQGLSDFIAAREREGARIADMLITRLDQINLQVATVRQLLPTLIERQQQLLKNRIAAAEATVDDARLAGEIVLLAQKADVAEELDRLDSHVAEVRTQLYQDEPIGRRLDFLIQELNREANTLAAKSISSATTQCAIELKVMIEQMREQVQNIE